MPPNLDSDSHPPPGDSGGTFFSGQDLETLEDTIMKNEFIRNTLKCTACNARYNSKGRSGNTNASGVRRISLICSNCKVSRVLRSVLVDAHDVIALKKEDLSRGETETVQAWKDLNALEANLARTDKQAGKRPATQSVKPLTQRKLGFVQVTTTNPNEVSSSDDESEQPATRRRFIESQVSCVFRPTPPTLPNVSDSTPFIFNAASSISNSDANIANTLTLLPDNMTAPSSAAQDLNNMTSSPAIAANSNDMDEDISNDTPTDLADETSPIDTAALIEENERLKVQIIRLEATIARQNLRISQQANQIDDLCSGKNNNEKIQKVNMEKKTRSYANVAKTPVMPGNEERNRLRRINQKKISELTPSEVKLIKEMGANDEERVPQAFHRLHIKIRPPRGAKKESVQIMRKRMFQFLKIMKLEKHVTLATTIGKSIYEVYVCTNALDRFIAIAEKEKLSILTEFNPADFSDISNDEIRMKARISAATRLAYLLTRAKFANLRSAILNGFDNTTILRAQTLATDLTNSRIQDWKTRYQNTNANAKPSQSGSSLRDLIIQRDLGKDESILNPEADTTNEAEPALATSNFLNPTTNEEMDIEAIINSEPEASEQLISQVVSSNPNDI